MLQKFFEAWRLACDCQITLAERRLLLRCVLLPSETVRFVSEWRQNGATSAKSQGGDQRSHRIEGSPRDDPERDQSQARHDPGPDRRNARSRDGSFVCAELGLALSRPSRHHLQKNR